MKTESNIKIAGVSMVVTSTQYWAVMFGLSKKKHQLQIKDMSSIWSSYSQSNSRCNQRSTCQVKPFTISFNTLPYSTCRTPSGFKYGSAEGIYPRCSALIKKWSAMVVGMNCQSQLFQNNSKGRNKKCQENQTKKYSIK